MTAPRAHNRPRRPWPWLTLLAGLLAFGLAAGLHPPLLLATVDLARGVVGPAPVAYAETVFFRVGTLWRQTRVQLGDRAPRWRLELTPTPASSAAQLPTTMPPTATHPPSATAQPPTATPTTIPTPTATATPLATPTPTARLFFAPTPVPELAPPSPTLVAVAPTVAAPSQTPPSQPLPTATATQPPTPVAPPAAPSQAPATAVPIQPLLVPVAPAASGPRADWPPAPLPAVIGDGQLPGEGLWQPLSAPADGGVPLIAVTVLRPDPDRPDIQVAIAAIDMTRALLQPVAGLQEPPLQAGSQRSGVVPADVQGSGRLLAAFNGGFKAIHGNDGMAAGGEVYAPALPGRATLAVLEDGSLLMGLWGRDLGPDDRLAAWRQNGQLLIDAGTVTEQARQGGLGWGATVDLQAETWRSGIGLSADRRTLFYAVGDALTAPRLAQVLQSAGAWHALQLDINNYWVRFVTFQQTANGQLFAAPLISAMLREPSKYLVPEQRDFFYLVTR